MVAFAAAMAGGSCNSGKPGPNPVPTIATVVVAPVNPDAGSDCSAACQARRANGCPNGQPIATLEHCVSMCADGRKQTVSPDAECLALIYTCGEKCP